MAKEEKHTGGRKVKSGIMYISLCSRRAWRVEFKTHETGEDKVRVESYGFDYFKGVRPAFERAVKARYDFEIKTFGKSVIDLEKMDEYWETVNKNYPPEKLKWL